MVKYGKEILLYNQVCLSDVTVPYLLKQEMRDCV